MVEIRHIDDVLPAIKGRSDFVVIEKDGYTAVDYLFVDRDTFDCPIRMECRGIKFGPDGRIIARPFQKFFNIGERQQAHEVDFGQPHRVFEKLDGSMIHSAFVGDNLRLMTRKGVTDVSMRAEQEFLNKGNYCGFYDFMETCLVSGMTPIFEFTAPENRIVLRYSQPQLTLLAVRDMVSGEYMDPDRARYNADVFGVPHVADIGRVGDDVGGFVDRIRALEDEEGVVVCFHDGHRIKLKADEYVRKHKALDGLQSKKSALALVLDSLVDDVVPLLDEADADELREFEHEVNLELQNVHRRAQRVVEMHGHKDRKEFAVNHVSVLPQEERSLAFTILDGKDGWEVAKKLARKNSDFIKAKWRGE